MTITICCVSGPSHQGFPTWRAYIRSYDRNGTDPFIGRRLVALLHEAGARPRRNTLLFFGGCAGMESFDVLAANMIGVATTARNLIVAQELMEAAFFDAAVERFHAWSKRPDAALWYAMNWAEAVHP